mgnify:CR=1 FL=1
MGMYTGKPLFIWVATILMIVVETKIFGWPYRMDSNMITKNFSMEELVASVTAIMKGIDNTPEKEVEARLI